MKVQCIKLPNVRVYLIICLNPSKSIDRNPWLYFWGDTVLEAQFLETHTPMDSAKPYPQLCLCFLNKISIYRRFHQLKHLQIPPKKCVLSNFIASWFWCFADCGQQLWLSATFKNKKSRPKCTAPFSFQGITGRDSMFARRNWLALWDRFLFSYFGAAPENSGGLS